MIISHVSQHESVRLFQFAVKTAGITWKPVYCFWVDGLLIDTAMSKAAAAVCVQLDKNPPQQIVLTHHHEDHSGNVALLKNRYGIPAYAHLLTLPIVADEVPVFLYQRVAFGSVLPTELLPIPDQIQTERYTFEVIHTPGHSHDQISLYEPHQGWLFSGDLYVAEKIKYFKRGEVMKDQITSIRELLTRDFDTLFCCHNPKLTHGKAHLQAKLEYLENYYGQVLVYHQRGFSPKAILTAMKLKENHMIRWFSGGDVSAINMIRAVLNHP